MSQHKILAHHGIPLPDVVENSAKQSAEIQAGLQQEVRVQAHFPQHSQQQEQLVVGVRPRTEGHAQTQVLRTWTQEGQAKGSRHWTPKPRLDCVSPSRRCCSWLRGSFSVPSYTDSHSWGMRRLCANKVAAQLTIMKKQHANSSTGSSQQMHGTHRRSPSVKGGWRFSNGKRETKAAPMFTSTSATSAKLGTHTLNCWSPFLTENQRTSYRTVQTWCSKKKKKTCVWWNTDQYYKQQCRQCREESEISSGKRPFRCGPTSSDKCRSGERWKSHITLHFTAGVGTFSDSEGFYILTEEPEQHQMDAVH